MRLKAFLLIAMLLVIGPAGSLRVADAELEPLVRSGWASEAAAHWSEATYLSESSTHLAELDVFVPSPYGAFDPLIEADPVPALDVAKTTESLLLIQLSTVDAQLAYDLEGSFGVDLIERLSTSVWLARGTASTSIEAILAADIVRWAAVQAPGWRVHPLLLAAEQRLVIQSVIATDVAEDVVESLKSDLQAAGIRAVDCGATDCRMVLDAESYAEQILTIAADERFLWSEPAPVLVLTNAAAAAQAGVSAVLSNWNSGLDGSDEIVSIVDTGLDMDHSDFASQLIAVHNGFGLDQSPDDTNSGHGTHVTGTLLGSGSGEAGAVGIAPEAVLHMYQLENDGLNLMGRIGSIYDMLDDASDTGAHLQTTSWVSESSGGSYNSDSRSVDRFAYENREFLTLYSAGNNGSSGASTVAAPATAKNVLSVGAATVEAAPAAAGFSGQGPTYDGRIKPDLIAPGENICSSRAEEAASAVGTDCTGSTHSSGTMLHMSLSGASQATPVAAGAAVLTRQFLREEVGISAPASDLVRAILVNGAQDLGTADVPNGQEGWGMLDLERSLYPTFSGNPIQTWYDDDHSLNPGRMFIYAYDIDPAAGIDITLAWNDPSGSSSAAQSSSRLLNNLDLVLIAPDGTEYLGNDFNAGFSTSAGSADSINNLERVRLAPGQSTQSGVWQVQVHHRAGVDQEFSIVVTASGQNTPSSDLAVLSNSIYISEPIPLVNQQVLIRASWINQADLGTGVYQVRIIDTVTGQDLLSEHSISNDMPSLAGGAIGSIQVVHAFATTGTHDLRLEIDSNDVVAELSESNNQYDHPLTIAAEGVRLEVIAANGSIDSERQWSVDPFTQTGIDVDLRLYHEGTAEEEVEFSVLSIRRLDPDRPQLTLSTSDDWSYETDLASNTMSLPEEGIDGAIVNFSINIEDDDARLIEPIRYASAETVIVELIAKYVNDPLVVDTLQLTLTIESIADILVVVAGSGEVTAVPGAWASFTQSVMNTGNSPAIFDISCSSASGWEVRVGDSTSNQIELESLSQGVGVGTKIKARIPPVNSGQPALGHVEDLNCTVSDTAGTVADYHTTLKIIVGAQYSFEVFMLDDDGDKVPPKIFDPQYPVVPDQRLNLVLSVENTGNVELSLTPRVETSENDWWWSLTDSAAVDANGVEFLIQPAAVEQFSLETLVNGQAQMGTFNEFQIYVERTAFDYRLNTTRFVLQETPELIVVEYDSPCSAAAGNADACSIRVMNTGNVPLTLDWPVNSESGAGFSLPDDWTAFLTDSPTFIDVGVQATLKLHLQAEPTIAIGSQAIVGINVSAVLESGTEFYSIFSLDAVVRASSVITYVAIDSSGSAPLKENSLFDLEAETEVEFSIEVTNLGNTAIALVYTGDDSDEWEVSCTPQSTSIAAGASTVLSCLLQVPAAGAGVSDIELNLVATSLEAGLQVVDEPIVLRASSPVSAPTSQGLLGMSTMNGAIAIALIALVLLFAGVRLRRSARISDSGEDLMAAGQALDGDATTRLGAAMDVGGSENELVSGGVSSAEIQQALAKSKPALPKLELPGAPPLPAAPNLPETPQIQTPAMPAAAPSTTLFGFPPIPPEGIPPGWTMEQWLHYGHQWLSDQRKK